MLNIKQKFSLHEFGIGFTMFEDEEPDDVEGWLPFGLNWLLFDEFDIFKDILLSSVALMIFFEELCRLANYDLTIVFVFYHKHY